MNAYFSWLKLRKSHTTLLVGCMISAVLLLPSAVIASQDDDVILSFSTVGDSREDPKTPDLSAQNSIWLQNTKAWSRIIDEINKVISRNKFTR